MVIVLPMSPLSWKRCIRGSGKSECPLLIGRQGGRSLFLSPRLPFISVLFCFLFLFPPLLSNICVQAAAVQLHPLWHMLNRDSYAAPPNEAECNLGVLPQDVFSIKYFISCKSGGFLCTRFCYFCISIISAL